MYLRYFALALLCASLLVAGCSAGSQTNLPLAGQSASNPDAATRPTADQLRSLLDAELSRLGIDPDRAVRSVAQEGGQVFDLKAVINTGTEGGDPGVALSWTYRNVGDCDQNGEVAYADVTPLALNWMDVVSYDDPAQHDGFTRWPSGLPDDRGDAEPGDPPAPGSGAENWRRAAVDCDGNGEISITDLTPIGLNFGAVVTGYNIYRRTTGDFELLGTMQMGPLVDARLPRRLSYFDQSAADLLGESIEYEVRPIGLTSEEEGRESNVALAAEDNTPTYPQVTLDADVLQGETPLEVHFTATGDAGPDHTIVSYEWDFEGDGAYELDSGTDPQASHTYETPGKYVTRIRATDDKGTTAINGLVITAGEAPIAQFITTEQFFEVPLVMTLDARSSWSPVGEITKYEWDLDGDGTFEVDGGTFPTRSVEIDSPGDVSIGLRVTNELDLTATKYTDFSFHDDYDELEPNQTTGNATDIGTVSPGDPTLVLRGNIGANGYNGDEADWYSFDVAEGLMADLSLTTSGPGVKLDLALIDADGYSVLAQQQFIDSSGELMRGIRGAGTYYIAVTNANTTTGLHYDYEVDLKAQELELDEVEPNDTPAEAQDLGVISQSIFPGLWGNLGPGGYDGDSVDWYKFTLAEAHSVSVALDFFHHEADLELSVWDEQGVVLYGVSESVSDKEQVDVDLNPGIYTIKCYQHEGGTGTANYQLALIY